MNHPLWDPGTTGQPSKLDERIAPVGLAVESEPFPFLQLPRELRDKIYGYYLFPRGEAPAYCKTWAALCTGCRSKPKGLGSSLPRTLYVATDLFRVCRWISEESVFYMYSHIMFCSEDKNIAELFPFLSAIGPKNRLSIRKLKVRLKNGETFGSASLFGGPLNTKGRSLCRALDLISQGHSLRYLEIHFDDFDTFKRFVPTELMDSFFKIKGVEKFVFNKKIENRDWQIPKGEEKFKSVIDRMVQNAQKPKIDTLEATEEDPPYLKRAKERAVRLNTLLRTREELIGCRKMAEREVVEHEAKITMAMEKISSWTGRISEMEAELEQLAPPTPPE